MQFKLKSFFWLREKMDSSIRSARRMMEEVANERSDVLICYLL
jgi:hypothetical protein